MYSRAHLRPLLASCALLVAVANLAPAPVAARSSDDILTHSAPSSVPPTLYEGAPVPQPFGPQYFFGYVSDRSSYPGGIYFSVVEGFKDLRAHHPEVLQESLETTIEMNSTASPQRIASAQADARVDDGELLAGFSDAFGSELGAHLRAALADNRLPKTRALLDSGYFSRAQGPAASTIVEKAIFHYPRPFEQAPQAIVRHNTATEDFYQLSGSAAFPSGHTNQAALVTTLLAVVLPELAAPLLARGSVAGESRVILGVHSPLDVIGGRMTGLAAAADRWNDPKMRDALMQAGAELRAELEWRAGAPLSEVLARQEQSGGAYLSNEQAATMYAAQATYGLAPIYDQQAPMLVPQAAPDLLITRFPELTYDQRARVLAATSLPAGWPLDDQSARGSWQRLNLAAALSATVTVQADGSLCVNGHNA